MNKVVMYNKSNPSTVKYTIWLDTQFRNTFTMTFKQTDNRGRVASDVMYFDITVCGNESISYNNGATPMKWILTSTSATPYSFYRFSNTDNVSQHFTVANTGTNTHTDCIYAVFETFEDAACTTPLNDPKLTHTATRLDWETAGANYVTIDISVPFLTKYKYI